MLLELSLLVLEDKNLVHHRVPGVMNADEHEEERRSSDHEQRRTSMAVGHESRQRQNRVRHGWEHEMKHPVFQHGMVDPLRAHSPKHDDAVDQSTQAHPTPQNRDHTNPVPGST